MKLIELRDLAGHFIFGWILGGDRVAVLRSNVTRSGEVLVKPGSVQWGDAATESGSGTALSPFGLLESTRPEEESGLDEDLKSDIGGEG